MIDSEQIQTKVYDFDKQLMLWKKWEEVVLKHLRSKNNIIEVKDFSDDKQRQVLWIDAMMIYESTEWIFYASFFDIKTDFKLHITWHIFIETTTSWLERWCMLTTKAEQFIYYEPVYWKLYYIPIFPLRRWYKKYWIAKKHFPVRNKMYDWEWIRLTPDELLEIVPMMEIEDCEPLRWFDASNFDIV